MILVIDSTNIDDAVSLVSLLLGENDSFKKFNIIYI